MFKNSCFLLYAAKQVFTFIRKILSNKTFEPSFEATPISEFLTLRFTIFKFDFSPTDTALSSHESNSELKIK